MSELTSNNEIMHSIMPSAEDVEKYAHNLGSLLGQMREQSGFDPLAKSFHTVDPLETEEGKVTPNKISYSSNQLYAHNDNIEMKSYRRISDYELKELSQLDPYVSAIISKRTAQAAIIGRESISRFDKGSRITEVEPLLAEDFDSKEKYEHEIAVRRKEMKFLMKWFQNCGTQEKEILDSAFNGTSDLTFKTCRLHEFISAQTRNLLTFGRMGSQKLLDENDTILMFRPVPIEVIAPVIPGKDVFVQKDMLAQGFDYEEIKAYNDLKPEERPPVWVQRYDGRNIALFTEKQLQIKFFQKQALFELDGYPWAPIELAVFMIFVHQQTLGYLRNQYVKGMAAKGALIIKADNPAAKLSRADLEHIRKDFHNYVTRNDNSAAFPILSGPIDVQFIPMSTNPSDMQFLQLEEHIVRALCSAFQISPHEMGYGNLSVGQGGLTQASKQEEVINGEETGLRIILDTVYDALNELMYETYPETEGKYRLTYTGVGDDTRDSVISRNAAELQTSATMSSIWADSEKKVSFPYGGAVPLSQAFHAGVAKYMKYGRFMEEFFGEEGASKKPEYDFLIDPNLNQAYQTLKVKPMKMQQAEAQMQVESEKQQMDMQNQQMQMAAQQVQNPQQGGQQPGAAEGGEGQDQQQQPPQQEGDGQSSEPAQKSLEEAYHEKVGLKKSMRTYFSEWLKLN